MNLQPDRRVSPRDPNAYYMALVGGEKTPAPDDTTPEAVETPGVNPGLIAPGALANAFREIASAASRYVGEARRRLAA